MNEKDLLIFKIDKLIIIIAFANQFHLCGVIRDSISITTNLYFHYKSVADICQAVGRYTSGQEKRLMLLSAAETLLYVDSISLIVPRRSPGSFSYELARIHQSTGRASFTLIKEIHPVNFTNMQYHLLHHHFLLRV